MVRLKLGLGAAIGVVLGFGGRLSGGTEAMGARLPAAGDRGCGTGSMRSTFELLVIIFLIAAFVLGLLLYVIVRFRASNNPVPSRTSHNTVIELLWTVVPVVILVIIAIPSFKLMYYMDSNPDAKMTIKVTGHQWYWSYE